MNELYKLLDDCHTALAKTSLDDKQYNELSSRLIAQKQALLQANVSGNEALRVSLPSETLKAFDELANCLFHESVIMQEDMDSIREKFNELYGSCINLIERGNDC